MAEDALRFCVRCDEFAPKAVREVVARLSGLDWVAGDAMLVASELVTNAVRHSLCSEHELLTICISFDGRVRITVRDPGTAGREAKIADRSVELGGHGLKVVEQLSRRWGTEREPNGYRVWAELDLPSH
jgi:anti-sigma regulatory factor (Ser/Thr protein kinase)